MTTHVGTLIVGAGLAGTYIARELARQKQPFLLVESRDRFGGRILTHSPSAIDLGPAWFWSANHRMRKLLSSLGIERTEQYCQGLGLFETAQGTHKINQPQGPDSFRLKGGWQVLIDTLAADIPNHNVLLSNRVTQLHKRNGTVRVTLVSSQNETKRIDARQVILAVPPRIIAEQLVFIPGIEPHLTEQWRHTPTWMAGHAKALILTEKADWREQGLSGFAYSQVGPLQEIHDACEDKQAALFGFFTVNAQQRKAAGKANLIRAINRQVSGLYNVQPTKVVIHDWSTEPFTATPEDAIPLSTHPKYGTHPIQLWDDKVILASSESASEFGGYLEGALASAQYALAHIKKVTLNL